MRENKGVLVQRSGVCEVLDRFEELEKSLDLGHERVGGVPWWDLVRYPLYQEILASLGYLERRKSTGFGKTTKPDLRRWLTKGKKIFSIVGVRSPIWVSRNHVLVFGHPRRKYENGEYVDIYSDPFIDLLPTGVHASVIERPLAGEHLKPCRTKKLFHIELLLLLSCLLSRARAPQLSHSDCERLQSIDNSFYETFGLRLDIKKKVIASLRAYAGDFAIFNAFFKIKKPTHVVIVVSAGYEAVVGAAKSLSIPTIELQHGSPARGKMNYDYSSGIKKDTFPDWFASFGPFWASGLSFPIPTNRVFSLGFPYLTKKLNYCCGFAKSERLVVVSQITVAAKLVEFACRLAGRLGRTVQIVYKPHPLEWLGGWLPHARELEEAGVRVAGEEEDLYELLATARWQLGVYSTALYEGIALGAACFILKAPGYEHMSRLVDWGLAEYVQGPEDVRLDKVVSREKRAEIFAEADSQAVARLLEVASEEDLRGHAP